MLVSLLGQEAIPAFRVKLGRKVRPAFKDQKAIRVMLDFKVQPG
jgi:hypothetical protein